MDQHFCGGTTQKMFLGSMFSVDNLNGWVGVLAFLSGVQEKIEACHDMT
jgi:hypothetical protein